VEGTDVASSQWRDPRPANTSRMQRGNNDQIVVIG